MHFAQPGTAVSSTILLELSTRITTKKENFFTICCCTDLRVACTIVRLTVSREKCIEPFFVLHFAWLLIQFYEFQWMHFYHLSWCMNVIHNMTERTRKLLAHIINRWNMLHFHRNLNECRAFHYYLLQIKWLNNRNDAQLKWKRSQEQVIWQVCAG